MTTDKQEITARAHTNIALVKYWGKKDDNLIIPQTDSISLTLADFYTDTTVAFDDQLSADSLKIDNKPIFDKEALKVQKVLDLVRNLAKINTYAKVSSTNHVPMAAGLASSASGFAALTAAASRAAGLDLSDTDLSRLARQGSGSASRSIFGGFVQWHSGNDNETSFATQIDSAQNLDIKVVALIIKKSRKKHSSTQAMRESVETSPYYPVWCQVVAKDLKTITQAIRTHDFDLLGSTSELNAMRMHALTLSSDPAFTYFNGQTIELLEKVKELRADNVNCYATVDAGPNIKVLCQSKDLNQIITVFSQLIGPENVIATEPGSGIRYL